MAIVQGACDSFLYELFGAVHDFTADTIKVALYSNSASLGPETTAYTATGEVTGTGYTAGGATLTPTRSLDNSTAFIDFADVSWPAATITARGALIYNASKSNKAIWVLNFGLDRVYTASTFPLVFPPANYRDALIRLAR